VLTLLTVEGFVPGSPLKEWWRLFKKSGTARCKAGEIPRNETYFLYIE